MRALNQIAIVVLLALSSAALGQDGSHQSEIAVNKRPLRDFQKKAQEKFSSKQVDIAAPFRIELDVFLDTNSKIDAAKSKVVRIEGDRQIAGLAKDAILAIGDSGFLAYLRNADPTAQHVVIEAGQDKETVQASVKLEGASEVQVKNLASSLSMFAAAASKTMDKSNPDLFFLENLNVAADGRYLVIRFVAPAVDVQKRITEALSKHKSE